MSVNAFGQVHLGRNFYSEFFLKTRLIEVTERFGMGCRIKIDSMKAATPANRIGVGPRPANLRQELGSNAKGAQLPMCRMSG
jgi:hypothetical protein